MEYNPYAKRCAVLKKEYLSAERERQELRDQLDWYESFNASIVSNVLRRANQELDSSKRKLEEVQVNVAAQTLREKALREAASLGWDPRFWFSSERSAKRRDLADHRWSLGQLVEERNQLRLRVQAKSEQIGMRQAELDRYEGFDGREAAAALKSLDPKLVQLSAELEKLKPKKDQMDRQLRAPLEELMEMQSRKGPLETAIAQAEELEQRLSSADNAYERHLVHEECGATFGESKPARVITAKKKELASVERSLGKLNDRLKAIAQSG